MSTYLVRVRWPVRTVLARSGFAHSWARTIGGTGLSQAVRVARQQHGIERPEHAEPEPVVVEGQTKFMRRRKRSSRRAALAEPSVDYGDRSGHKASMCVFPLDIERRDTLARACRREHAASTTLSTWLTTCWSTHWLMTI
jgi:hypothetical protein